MFKKSSYIIYRLHIEGMKCGMCEAHINHVIRTNFKIKKVKSSRHKNETIIYSLEPLDISKIKEAINQTGYKLLDIKEEK